MNDEEDFDVSEVRELLAPVVADRGGSAAPADAIVAAGRRRVVARRLAVTGSTLALVAAVPLAAAAIAAGTGRTGTTSTTAVRPGISGAPASSPGTPEPSPRATPTPDLQGLPADPIPLASGSTADGKRWSVSGFGSMEVYDSAHPDRKLPCLNLLVAHDGQTSGITEPFYAAYCLPVIGDDYRLYWLDADGKAGVGILAVGLAPEKTVKVVAHVDGVAAPITVDTVPAPGLPDRTLFIVPIPYLVTVHATYDAYDAKGTLVGTRDEQR